MRVLFIKYAMSSADLESGPTQTGIDVIEPRNAFESLV